MPMFLKRVSMRRVTHPKFFRIHSAPEYTVLSIRVLDTRDGYAGGYFLIDKGIHIPKHARTSVKYLRIWLARALDREIFLVYVPRDSPWYMQTVTVATAAREQWIKVAGARGSVQYTYTRAAGDELEPNWNDLPPMNEFIQKAFGCRIIDTCHHSIIRRLGGELSSCEKKVDDGFPEYEALIP